VLRIVLPVVASSSAIGLLRRTITVTDVLPIGVVDEIVVRVDVDVVVPAAAPPAVVAPSSAPGRSHRQANSKRDRHPRGVIPGRRIENGRVGISWRAGRRLDNFVADGKLPVGAVRDFGFYVQLGYMVVPKRIELYGATSYVFSNYGHPKEFIVGGNYYPWNTRNARVNIQLINVDHSPVSSTFGFYLGQLTGQVFTIGVTGFY
jgi:hypothetical protein